MNCNKLDEMSTQINSPVPFWFLNGHMDEWHIIREFEMMAEKGISEVIVHPRYGLQTEYLSDDWFELFGWCVREAQKHGIYLWIYDELNWPSGTAGHKVMEINPDYRSKFLAISQIPISQIDFDNFIPGLYMVAANIEGGTITKTKTLGSIDALKALTGDWQIFNCQLNYDDAYVDSLSFEAVDLFKKLTHDEYFKRFGDEFGKTVRAVFTDEPSIYWVSVGYDDWNLPFTNDYVSTFIDRYGYDPITMIPYLYYRSKDSLAVRSDYWEHAGYLFNERYHGNLSKWCREHGVIYTGHNNCEEPLRYQIRYEGNAFDTMRTMDIPGVDHLQKATLGNRWISIIGHKICSSATHIAGKSRCMSESFGVMDWDTTYTNLKRVVDWQYGLGINMMIPHAIFHTIAGPTKRESPPSFFYQSPHWEDFEYLGMYLRNLEKMLVGGRHLCRVAIMYPLSGLWATYQTDRKTSDFEHTENFLNSLCLELIKNQIDFDLLDFRALCEADLEDGKIKLSDEEYDFLIVPSSPFMRPIEVARLSEISKSGVNTTFFHRSMEPLRDNLPEHFAKAAFVRTEEIQPAINVLKKQLADDIQLSGGGADDILAYRRVKDGKKITFLLNRSEKHRKVTATLKDYPNPAIFDQETGTFTKLEGRQTGMKLQTELRFEANKSLFIVSDMQDAPSLEVSTCEPTDITIEELNMSIPYNVASIYKFMSQSKGGEIDVRKDARIIPACWDPRVPSDFEVADTYETCVDVLFDPKGVSLVVDSDFAECEVYLNGTRIEFTPCCAESDEGFYLTDFSDVRASVDGLLKQGANTFRVESPVKLSEPLRLVGDFQVKLEDEHIALSATGEIDPFNPVADYPFFSGTVKYSAEFEIKGEFTSAVLDLGDVRDSASVKINGEFIGKRMWAPYKLDISQAAKTGRNTIEIEARNNMANLINGEPRPFGLLKAIIISVS